MRNKNILFCSIHNYDSNCEKEKDFESLFDYFTQINLIADPALQLMEQKGLENNYDITDEESALMTIRELLSNGLYLHPFFSILYDLYLNQQVDFREINAKSLVDLGVTDEYILQNLRQHFKSYEPEDEEFIVDSIENQLNCFFEDSTITAGFLDFSKQYSSLIQLAYPYPFAAYDYHRAFDVVIKAYGVGYLSEETLVKTLDKLSQSLQRKFDSWQQFWASVLLGKLYANVKHKHIQNLFLLDQKEFVHNLYQLIHSFPDLFYQSGIWPSSDFTSLAEAIENLFYARVKSSPYLLEYGSHAQLEEKSIHLFENYILNPLSENKISEYLLNYWEQSHLYYAQIDKQVGTYFWKKIQVFKKKHGLFFSEEEVPLLLLDRCVWTTKNFYYCKKTLFVEKLATIPLEQVKLKYDVNSSQVVTLTVNNKPINKYQLKQFELADLPLDLKSRCLKHQANLDKIASIFNSACKQLASRKSTH